VPLLRRALARTAWREASTAARCMDASGAVVVGVVDIMPHLLQRQSARGVLTRRGDGAHVAIARHSDRISGRLQSIARSAAPIVDASVVDIASYRARRGARIRRAVRIAALAPRSGITVAHQERIVGSDTREHLA
jgi:hypothetical protein